MKLLIAEDNPLLLRLLTSCFLKENYEVVVCKDGKEAIDIFDEEAPDLVITDLIMPISSGSELIYYIRDVRKSQIPILVLSATKFANKIIATLILGANDYIEKPFRLNELIIRVKKLLENKQPTQPLSSSLLQNVVLSLN